MPKTLVQSPRAPSGPGPYSPALRVGDFVFVSGQASIDPDTHEIIGDTIEEQTRNVLTYVEALLAEAGATLDDVVKVTTFLTRAEDYERFSAVYEEFFRNEPCPPAPRSERRRCGTTWSRSSASRTSGRAEPVSKTFPEAKDDAFFGRRGRLPRTVPGNMMNGHAEEGA